MQNQSRRLSPQIISQDTDAFNGLGTIVSYKTTRSEATPEGLQTVYQTMLTKQQIEIEQQARFKSAADEARRAEWEFHNAVLAMKEVVRGQFGADSNEAQAVGLKKKSDRKRPIRQKKTRIVV